MFFGKKRKSQTGDKKENVQRAPYDKREKTDSLAMVVTIVNRNQANYYVNQY